MTVRAGADVIAWRREVLRLAGFAAPLADALARAAVDLHDLLSLVDRGCPPPLAARILAPLDQPFGDVTSASSEA